MGSASEGEASEGEAIRALCGGNGVETSGGASPSPTDEMRYFDSLPIEGKVARANLFEYTN